MTALWIGMAHAAQGDVVRLIKREEPDIEIIASHIKEREDIVAEADQRLIEPHDDLDLPDPGLAYGHWLLSTASAKTVDALLCTRYRASVVDRTKDFEKMGVRLFAGASTRDSLQITEDKDAFTLRMSGIVPTIRSVRFDSVNGFEKAMKAFQPNEALCIKPIVGVYGRGFVRIAPEADLYQLLSGDAAASRTVTAETFAGAMDRSSAIEPMLLMEYLPGPEYSVDMVCDAGLVVAAVSRLKLDHYQIVETAGPQIEMARVICHELKLDGIVNVQTRGGDDGVQRALEVNTRISGGVGYSAAGGINLPAIFARHVAGRPLNVRMLRDPVAVRVATTAFLLPETTAKLTKDRAA